MHSKIYNIYKPIGQTPLEALEKFRAKKKLPKELKITYAGRLDPMAEGVLLLLTGDKVHEKEKYLNLDKTYRAQILFGVSTDTFDVLGKITNTDLCHSRSHECSRELSGIHKSWIPDNLQMHSGFWDDTKEIKNTLKEFTGKIPLPIPPYSSVPISGVPSFMHARAGKLSTKNSQSREMEIYTIKFNSYKQIPSAKVLKTVQNKLAKVNGDFRQEEIIKVWNKKLTDTITSPSLSLERRGIMQGNNTLGLLNITISCASGTYIRSIAHTLGEKLNTPALLYNLKRERVGKYKVEKSLKI